jgi:hypothetical protein
MKTKTGLIPQKVISFFGSLIASSFMACFFLTSCNSKDDLLNPASDDAGTLTSKLLHCDKIFTVSPSGNYNDDSYNIQTALNAAVAAGHGSTVQLTKGTFYLKGRIEVDEFDGFFKGAGKDKTIITTHDVVDFNISNGDTPALFKFRHGNNNISDLTIKISDPEPGNNADWGNALPCAIDITGNSIENPGTKDQPSRATFNNVKFVGGVGNLAGYNVAYFIMIGWEGWPPDPYAYSLNGGIKITNCEFQTAYYCIWSDFTKGPLTIGGSESSGNKFENTELGIEADDVDNSCSNISFNHFKKIYWTGINLWQGSIITTVSLSKYLVYSNDIEVISRIPESDFTNAIWLVDAGIFNGVYKDTRMDINVSNNKLYLHNIGFAGILGECPGNVVVTNNKIWGSAFAGIACGIFDNAPIGWETTSGWFLKGNNVQELNVHISPSWWTPPFQAAPIWLGQGTNNFIVYADKKDILDEGTNNIVIGDHNKRNGHSSPLQIKEEMIRHHDRMKWHHHPDMK